MKYYNTIEELNNDITKNKLMFSSSLAKNSYKKSIGVSTSFGNVTNLNSKNIPVVIINLSPTFNISANKINTSEKILNKIIKSADILPYVTYIYKNNITKKAIIKAITIKKPILDSEYSYNCIKSTHDELVYMISNVYKNNDNILFVFLGKYAEYQYLNNMLHTYNNNINTNIHTIYNKHISQFIDDNNYSENKSLLDDIDRIKRKINSLVKSK